MSHRDRAENCDSRAAECGQGHSCLDSCGLAAITGPMHLSVTLGLSCSLEKSFQHIDKVFLDGVDNIYQFVFGDVPPSRDPEPSQLKGQAQGCQTCKPPFAQLSLFL